MLTLGKSAVGDPLPSIEDLFGEMGTSILFKNLVGKVLDAKADPCHAQHIA